MKKQLLVLALCCSLFTACKQQENPSKETFLYSNIDYLNILENQSNTNNKEIHGTSFYIDFNDDFDSRKITDEYLTEHPDDYAGSSTYLSARLHCHYRIRRLEIRQQYAMTFDHFSNIETGLPRIVYTYSEKLTIDEINDVIQKNNFQRLPQSDYAISVLYETDLCVLD